MIYCEKEFISTNLSKHIKQIHGTYDSTRTNNSTYNTSRTSDRTYNSSRINDSTYNSTRIKDSTSNKTIKNNITSNKTNENNSTSETTLSDQLYVRTYIGSLKNNNNISYDKTDIDKINNILARNGILTNKIAKDSINQKEKKQFANNLKKLKELNSFNEKICNIL